ncbi:hypothetical protein SGFS_074280 [Streptomyces graminofaciens]|uniref:DUF3349 domain-containing protein n=1 Tax=Streptomyces graminofaciens TaxID=68212 RepID=A0ABN5VS60_9ACTN|nr:DUF3349 domain-containing protein [Streptomyces graminofaciens]BBC36134.1 hypothetical protein SGFS_074280 [Streptomyces graminofaciens]
MGEPSMESPVEPSVESPMESYLAEVVDGLASVFPDGVADEDYPPLLVILSESLSERNLGVVVEAAFGVDRHVARNDMAAALSVRRPAPGRVGRLKARMVERGWELDDEDDGGDGDDRDDEG